MASGNYSENFSDIANWTNNFASGIGAQYWASVALNATGTIPDGVRTSETTASFVTSTAEGVQKGAGNIQLLATNATDMSHAVAIDLLLDFTGVTAGTLSYDFATAFNSTGNRNGSLRVYTSTDGVTFTELPAASVLNFQNNVVFSQQIVQVAAAGLVHEQPDRAHPLLRLQRHRPGRLLGRASQGLDRQPRRDHHPGRPGRPRRAGDLESLDDSRGAGRHARRPRPGERGRHRARASTPSRWRGA